MLEVVIFFPAKALGFSSYLPLICLGVRGSLTHDAGIQFLFTPDMLVFRALLVRSQLGFSSYLPLICLFFVHFLYVHSWDSVLIYP